MPEPDAPGGCWGRALVVDAGTGGADLLPLRRDVLRDHLGGVGLGAWLVGRLAPDLVDPRAPEAPLVLAFSPLVGTPLTTSAKFAVVAVSPLTGLLTDALASSHFALAGKGTGHDALVVRGRAARLSVLLVDDDGPRLAPADHLAGLPAAQAEARLREHHGAHWQVMATGPAGERGVAFATLSHDGRHAGRGGLGAVLAAKNLKAVAVAGTAKVAPADPAAVLAAAADLRERSRGRSTSKYRELGTMASVLALNALSSLPTRNFAEATFAGAEGLGAQELAQAREVTRRSCASCTIGCTHLYTDAGGRKVRMEHQSVASLGSGCGVDDPEAVLAATALCDELGLDTISAGGTIAWAMECAGHGLLDVPWLRFGDGGAVLRALREIGDGSGVGPLLALGSRGAAAVVGQGSPAFAAQVKGLEVPGYDPRTMQATGLGLAVNARGADHNRSGGFDVDLSGDVDRLRGGDAHVRGAVEAEDRAAVMDSMILCSFLRKVFDDDPWPQWAHLVATVTGLSVDAVSLRATARRVVLAKRAVNERQGWQPADDWLPERFLSETLTVGSGRTAALTPARLRRMVDAYWAARGLSADGRVPHPDR